MQSFYQLETWHMREIRLCDLSYIIYIIKGFSIFGTKFSLQDKAITNIYMKKGRKFSILK
jgi:hypothetical protein